MPKRLMIVIAPLALMTEAFLTSPREFTACCVTVTESYSLMMLCTQVLPRNLWSESQL